jgi:hypothetical protein
MSKYPKVCFDRVLPRDLYRPRPSDDPNTGPRTRAAFEIRKLWPNGSTLHVRFMGGNSSQQNIVKQFAPQWSKHANLKLDFNNALDAEIRIAFEDDGAWSYIGKDCLDIPRNQPTMNFGWLDEGVVLHEFGHAIGLIHEHQNPLGGIQWNRPNVIRDLSGPPNFWDLPTIEHNLFAAYARDLINGTTLDKKSIMLYAIPASWTTDGFSSEPNEVLSDVDKSFAGDAKNYPFPAQPSTEIVELPVADTSATEAGIGTAGEEDLYKFTAVKAGSYTVETEGPTDVVMSLFGPNSQTKLIAEDDDSGLNRNAKIVADLTPGTYYVQVRHYNAAGGTGSYSIRVSLSGIVRSLSAAAARR